jgi:hypothetical protein
MKTPATEAELRDEYAKTSLHQAGVAYERALATCPWLLTVLSGAIDTRRRRIARQASSNAIQYQVTA